MAIRIKQRKDGGVGDFYLLGTGAAGGSTSPRQASRLEGSNEAEAQTSGFTDVSTPIKF
jgi:hypothetical protein